MLAKAKVESLSLSGYRKLKIDWIHMNCRAFLLVLHHPCSPSSAAKALPGRALGELGATFSSFEAKKQSHGGGETIGVDPRWCLAPSGAKFHKVCLATIYFRCHIPGSANVVVQLEACQVSPEVR